MTNPTPNNPVNLFDILNDTKPAPTTRVVVTNHPHNVIEAAERILFYYRHNNQVSIDYVLSGQFHQDIDSVTQYHDRVFSQVAPQTKKLEFYALAHYLVASQYLATALGK